MLYVFITVRPLAVKLLGSNQPMSALKDIEIVCQSVGSRPPAEISWFRDGQLLKPEREEVSFSFLLYISCKQTCERERKKKTGHGHRAMHTCSAHNKQTYMRKI